MNLIKENKKKSIIVLIVTIILIFILFLLFNNGSIITNVYYRTYTKENGWSKWSKNGETSGDLKNDILKIEIKTNDKNGEAVFRTYSVNNKWSSKEIKVNKNNENIVGIVFGLTDKLKRTSTICYRTYNDENRWMEWSCDGQTNGNINNNIKGLEVKVFLKNTSLDDYLKDYSKKEISSIGFEK